MKWCPAWEHAPAEGLPWPSGGDNPFASCEVMRPRLSAPRLLRPANDMWLCSSSLGIIDGECRQDCFDMKHWVAPWHAPLHASNYSQAISSLSFQRFRFSCRSSALAAGLRWAEPLGGAVLASQLLELGKMHKSVTDDALARFLAGIVPQLYRYVDSVFQVYICNH